MSQALNEADVLVVGAGIMGAGITQIAAQAGHQVLLYDVGEGAAAGAIAKLSATFDKLVAKGKITAESAAESLSKISVANSLADCASVGLVVEAIVENLGIKQKLFRDLEAVVSEDCVLATNTSSISVTSIANGMQHPERLVGMHFFNPVPLMKLVEVVSGLQTSPAVAEGIFELSGRWGKSRSMHVQRPVLLLIVLPDRFMPRRWRFCKNKRAVPRYWMPVYALSAFAWGRVS